MSYYIGVDIGTGSTKALAIESGTQKVLSSTQIAYPTYHPKPQYSEQDPALFWDAFTECVSSLVSELGKPDAIGISCAMHSLMGTTSGGKPLIPVITWADARSVNQAEKLRHHPHAQSLYEQTGMPIHAMSPLSKIIWMREQEPDLFHACEKFISIKEFIWHNLFGVFEVDFSLANATGLFDHRKKIWCDLALDLAGIDATHLSSPVPCTHMRTTHSFRIEELTDLPIVIGASDGCMASLGSGVTKPGPATLTIGTSGALRIASPVPVVNFEGMVFSYHLDDQTYICGGAINNGGAALNWYAQELLELTPSDSQPLLGSMNATAGAEGLVFLPYVFGERAPIWDSKASGVFFGIQSHHRKEHFTRAVVEGITVALSTIGEMLESDHALIDSLYVSGGFTRSTEWLQIVADVFNKKVIVTQNEDASAIGAALMAIKAHQSLSDYPVQASLIANKIVLPDASKHAIYYALRERSKRLYRLLKDEMTLAFDEQRASNQS